AARRKAEKARRTGGHTHAVHTIRHRLGAARLALTRRCITIRARRALGHALPIRQVLELRRAVLHALATLGRREIGGIAARRRDTLGRHSILVGAGDRAVRATQAGGRVAKQAAAAARLALVRDRVLESSGG